MAAFGLMTVTVFFVALIYALRETSVAVAYLLLYLAPALVAIGAAVLLDEPPSRRRLGAIFLSLSGCLLVLRADQPANLKANAFGIGLGLLSAVCYATYSLFGKALLGKYRNATVLTYYYLFGSVGLIVAKTLLAPGDWPDLAAVAVIAGYSGVVTTLAPIVLYTIGLRRLQASDASLIATFDLVVAIFLAALLIDERLTAPQWLGAAAIVGAVIMLTLPRSAREGDRLRREPVSDSSAALTS